MKSTKKRMFLSMLSVALCAVMLIGTTFAWFTDSVTSGKNKIVAGNLDVELYHNNGTGDVQVTESTTDLFAVTKWEPGVIAYENFTVKNAGDLALKYKLALNIADYNYVDGTNYNLTQVVKAAVVDGGFSGTRADAQALTYSTLDMFYEEGDLEVSETDGDVFGVVLYWEPSDSDNNYNLNNGAVSNDGEPLFIDLGIKLVATQLTSESDAFDNTYDAGAEFPAFAQGKTVDLTKAITLIGNGVSAEIPANAINDGVTVAGDVLALNVENTSATEGSAVYEVTLENITKDTPIENTASPVKVTINVGKNLVDVKASHNGVAMSTENFGADQTYAYDANTGILTIYTASFSPFEITYWVAKPTFTQNTLDAAAIANIGAVTFYRFGDTKPSGKTTSEILQELKKYNTTTKSLDAAYEFIAEETATEGLENFHADFVVKFNNAVPVNNVGLAGQYDSFSADWIGFDVPTFLGDAYIKDGNLKANTEVRLLETAGIYFTYDEICTTVQNFKCGVAKLGTLPAGTTVTVELRLYETVDTEWLHSPGMETGGYITCGTYTYTF